MIGRGVHGELGLTLRACVAACAAGVAMMGLAGCETEDKILKYRPFLSNVQGATTQTPAVGVETGEPAKVTTSSHEDGATTTMSNDEPVDPSVVAESYYDRLAKLPDKHVKLEAGDIGTLIRHLRWTLDEDRDEILIDQLLAEDLIERLRMKGEDPLDYVDWLHENRRDIEAMLARMPMAERSPTVTFVQTAKKQYCISLTGSAEKGMKFTELWVAMERGKYRLLWIS